MGEEEAKALAEMLKLNNTITNIDLGHTNIGEQGVQALAETLKLNNTITNIDLGDNHIGDEGAQALAEVLKLNTSVTHLNLRENKIGKEGATSLAEVLKLNTRMTKLNLRENNIGDEGVIALTEMLKLNTSVINLNLQENNTGEEGEKALAAIQNIILKNQTCYINKCKAVMDGKFDHLSLRDIQTLIPILDAQINHIDDEEKERKALHIHIKQQIMWIFLNHILLILDDIPEKHHIPPEIMAHITSFMVPSDIDLSTPAITHNTTPQPNRTFVKLVECSSQNINFRS